MKTAPKFLTFLAAASLAFASSAYSQVITSTETITPWSGSTQTFLGNQTLGQTFSNVSAVASMTYSFFTAGTSAAGSLTATFGQWNAGTSSFVADTTIDFGTINIPASTSWNPADTLVRGATTYQFFNQTFDLTSEFGAYPELVHSTFGYLTNPSLTYALMLTNTSGSPTGFALGLVFPDTAFAFGSGIPGVADYAFSQIVVYGGDQELVPVPEASTVASLCAAGLVAALVGFRIRQRRQLACEPAMSLAV